jgi:hypothetical protein
MWLSCLCAHPQVDDHATVAGLKLAIQQQLNVPLEQQRLSKDPGLLTAKQNGSSIRCGFVVLQQQQQLSRRMAFIRQFAPAPCVVARLHPVDTCTQVYSHKRVGVVGANCCAALQLAP